jgi:hypothetical protein
MKKLICMILTLVLLLSLASGCTKKISNDYPKANPISDFEYTTTEADENKIKITKYIGTDTSVVIPESIDKKEVTQIGESAFYKTNVQTLVMPNTVKNIHSIAFAECSELKEVTFSTNLVSVAFGAFANCTSLIRADLSVDTMKIVDEIAFQGCDKLEEVKFGDNITVIGKEAFQGCAALKEVLLPKNLAEIGEYAFGDCTSVEKIWIPKTLEKWSWSPFIGNTSVTEIVFEDGLKAIGSYGAFAGCQVETLRIPASVESIADIAFTAFPRLKEVYFEGNAPTVGGNPFATPEQDVKVYYDPKTTGWDTTPLRDENIVIPLDTTS